MENEKYLFVVSGAAGTGKDSVVSALRKAHPEIEKTVSATTRSPRPGEQEGVDYSYRTQEQFRQLIDTDQVVEYNFYNGNYSYYAVERERRREEQLKHHEHELAEKKRLEATARSMHEHGTEHLAKRAASIEKRIARMKVTDRPKTDKKMTVTFGDPNYETEEVLKVRDITKSYDGREILHDVSFNIRNRERVALLGANGAGKTTMLKILLGEETPDSGVIRKGVGLKPAYLPQQVHFANPHRNLIDTLIMFPYVIPGSVLGIGLIVAFNRKPIILVGTAAIMIISYIIRKLPYTVRSGSAFLYQMDPFIEEASINLGVSPMKTFFTVTARMMLPGIMSGAVLSWITCINELSSSIMLYSGKTSTIAVAIYQEVVRMSDGTAAALATILTLTTIISLVIVFRATKGKVKIV